MRQDRRGDRYAKVLGCARLAECSLRSLVKDGRDNLEVSRRTTFSEDGSGMGKSLLGTEPTCRIGWVCGN